MKIKKSLIIEDTEQAKDLLEEFISRLPFFAKPDVCATAESAMLFLAKNSYDIIFLDIELPGLSGIELLQTFQQRYPVVITTSHVDFALESYDLNVVDYLVKPLTFPRFARAVNRVLKSENQHAETQHEIFLKIGRKFQLFKYSEIDYIEADGAYSKVWYENKFVLVNDSISVIQERLPKQTFVRIHKSFIINISKLTAYDYRTVWLKTDKLPIGEVYRKSFQNSITGSSE